MKYWVTIQVSTDNVKTLYIGDSKKKANDIAKKNEDIENDYYCYVDFYDSEIKKLDAKKVK